MVFVLVGRRILKSFSHVVSLSFPTILNTRETRKISNTYMTTALISLPYARRPTVYACLRRPFSDCGLYSTIRTWQLKKEKVEFPFTWLEGGWRIKPKTKPLKFRLRRTADKNTTICSMTSVQDSRCIALDSFKLFSNLFPFLQMVSLVNIFEVWVNWASIRKRFSGQDYKKIRKYFATHLFLEQVNSAFCERK